MNISIWNVFTQNIHNWNSFFRLTKVYTSSSAEIKRTVLRVLENPVRLYSIVHISWFLCLVSAYLSLCVVTQVKGMGMHSPELISLVENCPKGAETLITRILHILTENSESPTRQYICLIIHCMSRSEIICRCAFIGVGGACSRVVPQARWWRPLPYPYSNWPQQEGGHLCSSATYQTQPCRRERSLQSVDLSIHPSHKPAMT